MKILRAMEYVAVVLILVGIVGGLGKALVDYACGLAPSHVSAADPVFAPSEMEKEIYLAGLKRIGTALN